jgi:hypothetical protein
MALLAEWLRRLTRNQVGYPAAQCSVPPSISHAPALTNADVGFAMGIAGTVVAALNLALLLHCIGLLATATLKFAVFCCSATLM